MDYLRWKCHEKSFKVKKDGIEIADFPDTGRGIKATTDLPDGQLILTVKDVITVEKIIEAELDGQMKLMLAILLKIIEPVLNPAELSSPSNSAWKIAQTW